MTEPIPAAAEIPSAARHIDLADVTPIDTSISTANAADLPALTELLGILFHQEAEFTADATRQQCGLAMILARPELGTILVARDQNQRIVGMVLLLFTVSTALGGPVCWLEDFVVHPDARGAGWGGRLMTAAIDVARRRGMLRITLLTDGDNHAASRFYARHGFTHSPMTPWRLQLTPAALNLPQQS